MVLFTRNVKKIKDAAHKNDDVDGTCNEPKHWHTEQRFNNAVYIVKHNLAHIKHTCWPPRVRLMLHFQAGVALRDDPE